MINTNSFILLPFFSQTAEHKGSNRGDRPFHASNLVLMLKSNWDLGIMFLLLIVIGPVWFQDAVVTWWSADNSSYKTWNHDLLTWTVLFFFHLPFCRSPCTIHPGINSIPQLEWICNVDITWLCSPSGNFPSNAGPIASPFGNYVLYSLRTGTLQMMISSPNRQEHKRKWKHLTSISVFVYIHLFC